MAAPIARRNPHKLQETQGYTDCRCLDQSKGLGLGLPGAKRWPSAFTSCGFSFLKQMNGRRRNTRKEAGVCCVTDDGSLLLARVPVSDAGDEVCPFISKLFRPTPIHAFSPLIQNLTYIFNFNRAWSTDSDTAKDKDADLKK